MNFQQIRQQLIQQLHSVPERTYYNLNLIVGEQALDKKKTKGLNGGNDTYSRGVLNNDFINNVRCRNLFTNTITFVNTSNSVNITAGSLVENVSNQGYFDVTIGNKAGDVSQGDLSIAIGTNSGRYNQSESCISIGYNSGQNNQSTNSISIGANSGEVNQGVASFLQTSAISIGKGAGSISQPYGSIQIGKEAGYSNITNTYGGNIGIGCRAAYLDQQQDSVAVGNLSGYKYQANSNVSVGSEAGFLSGGSFAIALGLRSQNITSKLGSLSIGAFSGENNQSDIAISIGYQSGQSNQGISCTSIGYQAGQYNQYARSTAIGYQAGQYNQLDATAIGYQAGLKNMGNLCNAIGNKAGITNMHNYSTIINASSTPLNSTAIFRTYLNPIREVNVGSSKGMLHKNPITNEVVFYSNSVKTFIIQHPIYNNKFLSHACIEGPTADVFYRGIGKIDISNNFVVIDLPSYTKYISKNFNIQLSPILTYDFDGKFKKKYTYKFLDNENKFIIYGEPGDFSWIVHATREEFEVEPLKNSVTIKGNGPYTFIEK